MDIFMKSYQQDCLFDLTNLDLQTFSMIYSRTHQYHRTEWFKIRRNKVCESNNNEIGQRSAAILDASV